MSKVFWNFVGEMIERWWHVSQKTWDKRWMSEILDRDLTLKPTNVFFVRSRNNRSLSSLISLRKMQQRIVNQQKWRHRVTTGSWYPSCDPSKCMKNWLGKNNQPTSTYGCHLSFFFVATVFLFVFGLSSSAFFLVGFEAMWLPILLLGPTWASKFV